MLCQVKSLSENGFVPLEWPGEVSLTGVGQPPSPCCDLVPTRLASSSDRFIFQPSVRFWAAQLSGTNRWLGGGLESFCALQWTGVLWAAAKVGPQLLTQARVPSARGEHSNTHIVLPERRPR